MYIVEDVEVKYVKFMDILEEEMDGSLILVFVEIKAFVD